jgi:hypothetical protein
VRAHRRQHRRLIAGARPDLQHARLGAGEGERLAHQGHHVRLRDGLALADRERRVLVGVRQQLGRHEAVPRHAAHGIEDARVAHAACFELPRHHVLALALEGHVLQLSRYDHEPTSGRSASNDA